MKERFLPIETKYVQSLSKEIDEQIIFDQSIRDAQKISSEVDALLDEPNAPVGQSVERKGNGKVFRPDTPLITIYLGSGDSDGGAPSSQEKKNKARYKQSQRQTRKNK